MSSPAAPVAQVPLPPIARAIVFHAPAIQSFRSLPVAPSIQRTFRRRTGFVTLTIDFPHGTTSIPRVMRGLRAELILLGFSVRWIHGVCLELRSYRSRFTWVEAARAGFAEAA